MIWSDLIFVISTLAWCHKIETRTLWLYAFGVTLTAVLKHFWEAR